MKVMNTNRPMAMQIAMPTATVTATVMLVQMNIQKNPMQTIKRKDIPVVLRNEIIDVRHNHQRIVCRWNQPPNKIMTMAAAQIEIIER